MHLHKLLVLLLTMTIAIGCSVSVYKPLGLFEVEPYTRTLESSSAYGETISVVIDPMIQKLQLTQNDDGSFANRFRYDDYRSSVKASMQNMLEGSFQDVVFLKEAPKQGLTLHVHRLKPKVRRGEFITEASYELEHLFDYDMSLSLDGKTISNASGINAHPVSTALNSGRSQDWNVLPQRSLQLVLEDCYNQLFVEGLAEI